MKEQFIIAYFDAADKLFFCFRYLYMVFLDSITEPVENTGLFALYFST